MSQKILLSVLMLSMVMGVNAWGSLNDDESAVDEKENLKRKIDSILPDPLMPKKKKE